MGFFTKKRMRTLSTIVIFVHLFMIFSAYMPSQQAAAWSLFNKPKSKTETQSKQSNTSKSSSYKPSSNSSYNKTSYSSSSSKSKSSSTTTKTTTTNSYNSNKKGGFLSGITNKVSTAAKNVTSTVKQTASNVGKAVSTATKTATTAAKNVASNVGKSVSTAAKNVASTAKQTASNVGKAVSTATKTATTAAKNVASNVGKSVSTAAKNVASTAKQTASNVGKAVSTATKSVANSTKSIASRIANNVSTGVKTAASTVKSKVSNTLSNVKSKVMTVASKIKTGVTTAAANFTSKAIATATSIKNKVATSVVSTINKAKTIASYAKTGVKTLAKSISNGVSTALQKSKDAVTRYATLSWQNAKEGVKKVGSTVVSAVNKVQAANPRLWQGTMGTLQVIGGAFQVAGGVALSSTGLGAILGVPVAAHGASDVLQGAQDIWHAIRGNDKQGINFLQEGYKAVGRAIGGEKGEKIANGVFYVADIGLGLVNAGAWADTITNLKKMDKASDMLKYTKNLAKNKFITQPANFFKSIPSKITNIPASGTKLLSNIKNVPTSAVKKFTSIKDTVVKHGGMLSDAWKNSKQVVMGGVTLGSNFGPEISKFSDRAVDTVKQYFKATKGDEIAGIVNKGTAEAKYLTNIESKVTATNKANLPEWVADSFTDGNYRTVVTNDKVTLYRTFGGNADAGGGFATTKSAANRIQAKIDTALLPEWGNTRMYEAAIEVPKGQVLNIGKVAEQYTKTGTKLAGQADQVLLPQNWPLEWIKEIRVIPSK